MKRLVCICAFLILLTQNVFAVNMYKDELNKWGPRSLKAVETDKKSDGILFSGEQLRVESNGYHYMKAKLTINQIKPNSYNYVVVIVDNTPIITYDNFEQNPQDFYVWTKNRTVGDFRIRFYSIDQTTKQSNSDVYIALTEVTLFPTSPYIE